MDYFIVMMYRDAQSLRCNIQLGAQVCLDSKEDNKQLVEDEIERKKSFFLTHGVHIGMTNAPQPQQMEAEFKSVMTTPGSLREHRRHSE